MASGDLDFLSGGQSSSGDLARSNWKRNSWCSRQVWMRTLTAGTSLCSLRGSMSGGANVSVGPNTRARLAVLILFAAS